MSIKEMKWVISKERTEIVTRNDLDKTLLEG